MAQRWMTRRVARDESGTAIVEFAIVALLFFGLVFAGLDFGYAFTVRENMIHAAQEGLRDALVNGTDFNACNCGGGSSMDDYATRDVVTRLRSAIGSRVVQQSGATCIQNSHDPFSADGTTPIPTQANGPLQACTSFSNCLASDGTPIANTECMTVTVIYDYGHNSIVGSAIPLLSGGLGVMPTTLTIKATQRVS